ncbi:CRAL/TRIO domain-containing protein [Saitoella complicata NRRL Y-17804]|nr:CRAL/TRIO domain-containing protein [Saitoella complicata NRRL Y-17804]ODQ55932.1 CRAL/TRIO domain-containing protein [Saitoella complicata NRRL Y-17804]
MPTLTYPPSTPLSKLSPTELTSLHSLLTELARLHSTADPAINPLDLFLLLSSDHPDASLLKFLRARSYSAPNGLKQMLQTLAWRRQVGILELSGQGESGVLLDCPEILYGSTPDPPVGYIWGQDALHRPVVWIVLKSWEPKRIPREVLQKHLLVFFEELKGMAGWPVEGAMIVMDINGFSLTKHMDMQFYKFFMEITQSHFPESLGRCLIYGSSYQTRIFNVLFSLLSPMIDARVKSKIGFVSKKEELGREFEGGLESAWISARYGGMSGREYVYEAPPAEDLTITDAANAKFAKGRQEEEARAHQLLTKWFDLTNTWIKTSKSGTATEEEVMRAWREREDVGCEMRECWRRFMGCVKEGRKGLWERRGVLGGDGSVDWAKAL